MTSIRKRILTILLSIFVVIWVAMMTYTWYNTKHEIEEVFDAQLAQATNVLFGLTRHEVAEQGLEGFRFDLLETGLVHEYEKKLAFQVWKDGKLLLRSGSAPSFQMAQQFGYSDGNLDNQPWRFLYRNDTKSGLLVIVGEEYGVRKELASKIILQVFWPVIIVLPILALLIFVGVNKGLYPLQQLTNEIGRRSASQLDPVAIDRVPREVLPIISEINLLLEKLKRAMDIERQFTADASHELRTPLAALKAQAQVAQQAKDDSVREHALNKIVEGVDRSTHLVEQLLTLARLEPKALQAKFEKINLTKIAEYSIAQVAHIALEQQINISLDSSSTASLKGINTLLETLIINLLKNAFAHTPKKGKVEVLIADADIGVSISVSDSGSGIDQALHNRIFDRFYRSSGSAQVGSGLGLSIVKNIVEIHKGTIAVSDSDFGGAMITIYFPT